MFAGVMASDRRFFAQHPQRNCRIRPAWDIEIEHLVRVSSDHQAMMSAPEGQCWWMFVRRVAPGMRGRFPFLASHNLPPEPPEDVSEQFWQHHFAPRG
jgi:hypothetical protein